MCGDESASPPDSLQRAGALVDWHRLRATDVEDAEGGEVGAGGEDKEVGMWQGEWGRESKDMTQGEPKTLTFCHTWATWNVRSMCCGACTRKVCVCVQLGWHSVYTSVALTAVAAGWVRNLVSAASVQELSKKKKTQDDCQNSLFSKSLMKFLMKPLRPVAWCLNELDRAFQFCLTFIHYQPTYRLANCAGSMSPNLMSPTSSSSGSK